MYVCMYVCMCVYLCMCVYVCMYVCMLIFISRTQVIKPIPNNGIRHKKQNLKSKKYNSI